MDTDSPIIFHTTREQLSKIQPSYSLRTLIRTLIRNTYCSGPLAFISSNALENSLSNSGTEITDEHRIRTVRLEIVNKLIEIAIATEDPILQQSALSGTIQKFKSVGVGHIHKSNIAGINWGWNFHTENGENIGELAYVRLRHKDKSVIATRKDLLEELITLTKQ